MKASVALPPLENTAASRGWFAPLLARFGPLSAAKRTGFFMTTSAQPARSRAVGRARARMFSEERRRVSPRPFNRPCLFFLYGSFLRAPGRACVRRGGAVSAAGALLVGMRNVSRV